MKKKEITARAGSREAKSLSRAAIRLTGMADTSEKAIEKYLRERVEEEGGICLKYSNPNQVGYPDRAVLMPGGVTLWVELKSTGEKPTRLQQERFRRMGDIGHNVTVIDTKAAVDRFVNLAMAITGQYARMAETEIVNFGDWEEC